MRLTDAPVRIVAAALLLAAGLVGLVVREGLARAAGQEVRLEITGYDPRSLLSGHYVQFRIVQELPAGARCGPRGDREWVALRREGDHHRLLGAAASRAEALRLGDVAVRGRLDCDAGLVPPPGRTGPPGRAATTAVLDIGIDRIHLDQDQAEAMQRELNRPGAATAAKAQAVLSVGGDGKARLKGVVVGGRRVNLDWL